MTGPEILALGRNIAVDEFDHGHRRGVRGADAGLDDAGVTAVAVGVAGGDDVEQLGELSVVHQARMGQAAVRKSALLGQRNQLLDVGAELLRLGGGGGDLLMLDEGGGHVAEHCRAVGRGTLQLAAGDAMTHFFFSVRQGPVQGSPSQAALSGGGPQNRHPEPDPGSIFIAEAW